MQSGKASSRAATANGIYQTLIHTRKWRERERGNEDGRVKKEEVGGRQLAGGRTQNVEGKMKNAK
jgi:hypothetical protein